MSGPPHLTEAAEARFWDGLEATGRFFMGEADVQKALAKLVRTVDEYGSHHRTHFFPRHYSSGCANGAQNYLLGPRRLIRQVGRAQRSDRLSRARGDDFKRRARGGRPRIFDRRLCGLSVLGVSSSPRPRAVSAGPWRARGDDFNAERAEHARESPNENFATSAFTPSPRPRLCPRGRESPRTIKREWRSATAWSYGHLSGRCNGDLP